MTVRLYVEEEHPRTGALIDVDVECSTVPEAMVEHARAYTRYCRWARIEPVGPGATFEWTPGHGWEWA